MAHVITVIYNQSVRVISNGKKTVQFSILYTCTTVIKLPFTLVQKESNNKHVTENKLNKMGEKRKSKAIILRGGQHKGANSGSC